VLCIAHRLAGAVSRAADVRAERVGAQRRARYAQTVPYITVGFTAFVLLIPLAVTSTNAMIKRLGSKNWQRLHALVYVIAVAAILHYSWHKAGKNDFEQPNIYGLIVATPLLARVVKRVRAPRAKP
jgi:DMSO/TMAO reductase YedYZ heme-binding membrane subunit